SDGMPIGSEVPNVLSATIPAFGHLSMFTKELSRFPFNLPPTGLLRIWTDSPYGVSVTGLRARYNERADFLITATPPIPETPSTAQGPACFPTILQGGGYTTEIILFGNSPGKTTSGKLRYFSESGSPLVVPLN